MKTRSLSAVSTILLLGASFARVAYPAMPLSRAVDSLAAEGPGVVDARPQVVTRISLVGSVPGAAAGDQAQDLERKIHWPPPDSGAQGAIFIPQRVLEETPFEKWPINDVDRRFLWDLLGGWEEFKRKTQEERRVTLKRCDHAPEPYALGSLPDASSLENQILHHSDVTIVGTVVATVPGLLVSLRRVRTMVYLQVEEVLRDSQEWIAPGDVLSFARETGGRIELASGVLCTLPPSSGFSVEPGQRLLVKADYLHDHDPHIAATVVGPVRDGVVHVQPSGTLTDTRPRTLDSLREFVRASERGTVR